MSDLYTLASDSAYNLRLFFGVIIIPGWRDNHYTDL